MFCLFTFVYLFFVSNIVFVGEVFTPTLWMICRAERAEVPCLEPVRKPFSQCSAQQVHKGSRKQNRQCTELHNTVTVSQNNR